MPLPFIEAFARIRDVGIFRDFAGGDSTKLRRFNLIYGFNGSGKTTLSRLLASVARGSRHEQLPRTGAFEIGLQDGAHITSAALADNLLVNRLLVFNADFVEENLKWKEGTSSPIFYLGADQAAAASSLEGVQAEYARVLSSLSEADAVQSAEARALAENKRGTARTIAEQLALPPRQYEAPALTADYASPEFADVAPLAEEAVKQLRSVILMQEHPPKLNLVDAPSFRLQEVMADVREVAATTVGSILLADLNTHEEMLSWIRDGLDYHSAGHLRSCLFCGGAFGQNRERELRSVVDAGFDRLVKEIARVTERVKEAQRECIRLRESLPGVNDLSPDARESFELSRALHKTIFRQSERSLGEALGLLGQKTAAPNTALGEGRLVGETTASEWDASAANVVSAINSVLAQHNTGYDNFGLLKESARKRLKSHFLSRDREGYEAQLRLSAAADERGALLIDQRNRLKARIEEIQGSFRRHGPAAEAINKRLANYLRRTDIELVAIDNAFQIKRGGLPITGSLSEGEKTAVALCYFLASVAAEGRKAKELIVVLDDPISSLDSRALNYAFNFIRGALGGAGQLIVLTHNLHFMNEVKKWMKPLARSENGRTATASLLFVETTQAIDGTRSSTLVPMPTLIREYESEYHHLFSLVWAYEQQPDAYGGYFYLLPNALRKILEVFLAFHFPGSEGLGSKVEQAIANADHLDGVEISALQRLAHAESHGDSLQDLVSLSPQTLEETQRAVAALFKLIRATSPDHYDRMETLCRRALQ